MKHRSGLRHSWLTIAVVGLFGLGGCTTASSTTANEGAAPDPAALQRASMSAAPTAGPSVTLPSSAATTPATTPPSAGTVLRHSVESSSGSSDAGSTTSTPSGYDEPRTSSLGVTAADHIRAKSMVAGMSVADQAATVLMPAATTASATVAAVPYGGVILMGSDGVIDDTGTGSPQRVRDYVRGLQSVRNAALPPMLVGVDQEYGEVTRLTHGFTDFPGASVIAGTGQDNATALTEQVAAAAGQEMRAVGISVNFAPDADVVTDPESSAIGNRSYGGDPTTVGTFVAAAVSGYQRGGVAATIKHFPGIGGLTADTHETLPTLTESCSTWNSGGRVPFAAGAQAGAVLAMTGHVEFPAAGIDDVPASLSSVAVTKILRGNGSGGCRGLNYIGVTVTDSVEMEPVADHFSPGEAAWRAVAAGQDLILLPSDPAAARAGIVAAVRAGKLSSSRLAQAATAVVALQLAAARVIVPPLSVVNSRQHRDLAARARGE